MISGRRPVLAGLGLAMLGGGLFPAAASAASVMAEPFGMIGRIRALPGRRGDLIAILGGGTRAMPGCIAYLVAEDADDADLIWITELWDSKASHQASLALPEVRAAIAEGRPLIADFELSAETRPVASASFVAPAAS